MDESGQVTDDNGNVADGASQLVTEQNINSLNPPDGEIARDMEDLDNKESLSQTSNIEQKTNDPGEYDAQNQFEEQDNVQENDTLGQEINKEENEPQESYAQNQFGNQENAQEDDTLGQEIIEQQNDPEEQQNDPEEQQNDPEEQQSDPEKQQNDSEEQQNDPEEQQNDPEEQEPSSEAEIPVENHNKLEKQDGIPLNNTSEVVTASAMDREKEKTEKGLVSSPKPVTDNVATGTDISGENHETDPYAPSPVSRYDLNATATVKFVLMPSGQVATMRCHLGQSLGQLKSHFAAELKVKTSIILMLFDGKNLSDDITLGDLGVGPNGSVQLEIQSSDPVNQPIKPVQKRHEYHMPDVITVRVQTENGTFQDVVVEIERPVIKKPFLGGYRHKNTGVEFYHASAQTMAKPRPVSSAERFCRDTQTAQQRHQVQQTTNAMSTQMTKIGVYVSNMEDKLVIPGQYTTADEHHETILHNVVVIQKYYRRWLAHRYVDQVRKDKSERHEWEREEELRKKKEKEDRIRKEFERRMNPKSKEDFDLLYHALEKWRQEEGDRINSTLTGAERKAALCQLLEQETQLIASIGRHKLDAEMENKLSKIHGFLDKAAAPKRWKGPDGNVTEMDTPYTLRAQQLRDIYNTINMKYLTQDERLDVLLTLKHTVKEHDCKLTQEIVDLIDREADLLMRGVKESNLEGLRKRISTLFLQYCKTPIFNPEITRLLKVPQDPSTLRSNIYYCSSCNQYLPSTDFQLSSNSSTVGRCRRCLKTDNESRVRQDYSHYRFMLKALRRSEENYGDDSKIAFLLQESDLRYLVENVWSSQSVLSAWQDLYDLVLVRWDRHSEWAPWNCILLTKEEASAHEKLEDLTDAYGKTFVHKVKHKHTLARNYFSRLPGMAEHMRHAASAKLKSANQGPTVSGKAVPIRVT